LTTCTGKGKDGRSEKKRKIKAVHENMVSEKKRIDDTLLAFDSKFLHKINTLEKEIATVHDTMSTDMNNQFQKT